MHHPSIRSLGVYEIDAAKLNISPKVLYGATRRVERVLRRAAGHLPQYHAGAGDGVGQGLGCGRDPHNGKDANNDDEGNGGDLRHRHVALHQELRTRPKGEGVHKSGHGLRPSHHPGHDVQGLAVVFPRAVQVGLVALGEAALDAQGVDVPHGRDGLLGEARRLFAGELGLLVVLDDARPGAGPDERHDDKSRAQHQRRPPVHDQGDDERRREARHGGHGDGQLARDALLHMCHVGHDARRDLSGLVRVEEGHVLPDDGLEVGIAQCSRGALPDIVEADGGGIDEDKDGDRQIDPVERVGDDLAPRVCMGEGGTRIAAKYAYRLAVNDLLRN